MYKYLVLVVILVFLNACKTTKDNNAISDVNSTEGKSVVMKNCPENADCTLKILNNSSLIIKEDTIGELYPVIEKGNGTVIQYTFLRKGPEGTVDGDYSETLHFEIPNSTKILYLNDVNLQDVDLLFGKHCFCRGEAGYYKVNKGELQIIKTSKELTIDITYIVDDTTQETKQLTQTIKL